MLYRISVSAIALLLTGSFANAETSFNRISSFAVHQNLSVNEKPEQKTSAEIISASDDGTKLVYSDSPGKRVGFIDITNPNNPKPLGATLLDGEPTSVVFVRDKVFAAVNTSKSYTEPSGRLAIINAHDKSVQKYCELGGQPDSIALSPDKTRIAIAIENERNEDMNDGELPQLPAGFLILGRIAGDTVDCASLIKVDLTGLAAIAADDPEPEFVSFNTANQVAVTLQENNHIVIVDGNDGRLLSHFSAGKADLKNVDMKKDGKLSLSQNAEGILREPDAVKWLDDNRLVIANEGDYHGGSRGFSIFDKNGTLLYESGASFEHALAQVGHFPEGRADKKGVEPEGLEVAKFGTTPYLFVLSERGSAVGVYTLNGDTPNLKQILPSGIAPESAVAIPSRHLLVTANESDLADEGGARSHVMIYELQNGNAVYPTLTSAIQNEVPIGWGALSGLTASPSDPNILYAVSDSIYANAPTIYTIDASQKPARIVQSVIVSEKGEPAIKLDLEGIASDGDAGFWLVSEGNPEKQVDNALLHVNKDGAIDEKISLPDELTKHQTKYGLEGIALQGHGDNLTIWLAVQRPWKDDRDNTTKLLAYKPATKEWRFASYPLEKTKEGWVGVSELASHNGYLYVLERDNLVGDKAEIKRLYRVNSDTLKTASIGKKAEVVTKELVYDFLPDLQTLNHGYVLDKLEGFTFASNGKAYAVTDNDGVKDSSGETLFFEVPLQRQ